MDDISKDIIHQRKNVEVLYVPDSLIENIIIQHDDKIDGPSQNRSSRRKISEKENLITSPSNTRLTRSGRKIINRFQRFSLNDDCKDLQNNSTSVVYDLPKPEIKPDGELFDNNEVDGKDIFSFKTSKHQHGMANKACEVLAKRTETPRSKRLWMPNSAEIVKHDNLKTPHSLRNQLRKRLVDEAAKQEMDRLLEDSGSDYVPSSSSDSESSDSDCIEDSKLQNDEEDDEEKENKNYPSPPKKSRVQMKDYVFTSEDYFDRRYSKIMTSSHTLKKLKTPKLAQSQMKALLKDIPTTHKKSMGYLFGGVTNSFKHWLFCFCEGYNVLLYGLGSKGKILSSFHNKYLQNYSVFYINGYFPDITIKQILHVVASDFLKISNVPAQPHEVLEVIKDKLKHKTAQRIFLLISNLDGKSFQNDKAQAVFAELASIEKIHMVATIDHINSALLWDQNKLSSFNFIWEDCTNYQPYFEETSYEGSLMVNWSGKLALSSLKNVFNSLTVNSRKVFKILLQHQFTNSGSGNYSGMRFSELYRQCREGFIVSSDLALRTLLTEFTDHELVKWKKDTDHLFLSADLNILKRFSEEVDLDK